MFEVHYAIMKMYVLGTTEFNYWTSDNVQTLWIWNIVSQVVVIVFLLLQFANDPEHQAQLLVCSSLVNKVLAELLPVYVKESNHELVIG